MKKIFMYITLVCVISAMCLNVYALDTTSMNNDMSERATSSQKAQIVDILGFIELDKEAIGLENVDFSQLRIGNKLNRYMVTDQGIEITGYSYPIFHNDEIVLIATSLSGGFQISTYEAEAIESRGIDNIALVYDENGLCLFDGSRFDRVYQDTMITEDGYLSLCENSIVYENVSAQADDIVLTNLCYSESLYDQLSSASINTSPLDGYYYATVDFVSQNDEDICWAACVAMLTNSINDIYYSAEDIAIAYLGEDNMEDGLSLDKVSEILRGEVNNNNIMDEDIIDDCICDEDYDYTNSTISDSMIQYCMEDWRPIIAGFTRAGGIQGHHAVVIDAIHRGAGYIRVCDPNCGRIYSYRDYINEDQNYYGEYTYTSPANNRLYYMVEQISTYH